MSLCKDLEKDDNENDSNKNANNKTKQPQFSKLLSCTSVKGHIEPQYVLAHKCGHHELGMISPYPKSCKKFASAYHASFC